MKPFTAMKALIVLSTMFVLTSISPQLAADEDRGWLFFGHRVAGSYLVDLDLVGASGPFEVQAIATLTAHGGAVATDTDDYGFGTGAFFHSPKQGAWKRTGTRAISITVLEFAYDDLGHLTTVFKLKFEAEFDDFSFDTGGGAVVFDAFLPGQDVLDPTTIPVATGGGTFTFRRIAP